MNGSYTEATLKFLKLNTQAQQREAVVQGRSLSPYQLRYNGIQLSGVKIMTYILAHDLGTSGNKATLFSEQGELVASCTVSYSTHYFNRVWAEQDPDDWWKAVCESTQQLLAQSKIDSCQVAVVVLSGQMMGATCVDRQGNPLRPSIIYCDQRSEKEAADILSGISMEDAYKIIGHRIAAVYPLAKLLWVKNNEPEVFKKTFKTICAKDYINFRLTGIIATDYSDASGTNAFDLAGKCWSDIMIDVSGVDGSIFPDVFPSTHVLGELTGGAALATGLRAGTLVCCGGGDGACATVGVGSVRPGSAYHYLGSSGWIGLTTERPIFDKNMRTMTWAHCVPDYYHPSGSVQTAGAAYNWLKEQICTAESAKAADKNENVYDVMNELLLQSPIGANGLLFLPYLLGERSPRWNSNARGAFIGLTLTSRRCDMIRSVMEGITYNFAIIVDIFREHVQFDTMTVIGGGAKGQVWLQMMADIFGTKIQRPNFLEEATSIGAAIVGGVGAGIFKDFSIVGQFLRTEETLNPIPQNEKAYQKIRPLFDKAYHSLVELFDDLREI
ncbi:MAG: xylulokinase [Planctomycetaceae bacterium]|nr:xylulokinase [Planctomycetaceae bacterium]